MNWKMCDLHFAIYCPNFFVLNRPTVLQRWRLFSPFRTKWKYFLPNALRFPKDNFSWKAPRIRPFVLIKAACRLSWVWNIGGMILTGETEVLGEKHYTAWVVGGWMSMEHWWNDADRGNWSTGRKILYSVGGRWMNEYGALVEWYWQGKLKYWEKNIIQRGW